MSADPLFDGQGDHGDARGAWNPALRKLAEWGTDHEYNSGELTVRNGELYRSLQSSNQGNDPAGSPSWWLKLELAGVPWSSETGAPTAGDNDAAGYTTPWLWVDSATSTGYLKVGEAAGIAVWDEIAAGVQESRRVDTLTDSGLQGGNDLSQNLALALALGNLQPTATVADGDEFVIRRASDGLHRRVAKSDALGDAGVIKAFGISQADVNFEDFTAGVTGSGLDQILIRDVSEPINDQVRVITRDNLMSGYVKETRQVQTAEGIQGGGDLSQLRTHSLDVPGLTSAVPLATDTILFHDGTTHKRGLVQDILDLVGGGGGDVISVFGRTGAVVATAGDYTAGLVTFTPTGGLSSTNVQSACAELDTEKADKTLAVTAGPGLSGGGTLAAPFSIDLALTELTSSAPVGADSILYHNLTNGHRRTSVTTLMGLAPVQSVLGRTGDVVAAAGDYSAAQVTFAPTGGLSSTEVQAALAELDSEKADKTVAVTAGIGLAGGGTLAAAFTIDLALDELSTGAFAGTDSVVFHKSTTGHHRGTIDAMMALAPVQTVFGRSGAVVAAASDYDASQVDFSPTVGISATDVQAAIAELDTEKADKATSISTAAGSALSGGGDLSTSRSLAVDINGTTADTSAAAADLLLFHDAVLGQLRSIRYDNLLDFGGGMPALGAQVGSTDELLVLSGGSAKKATKSEVLPKRNWSVSSTKPTSTDDSSAGYEKGSIWGEAQDASGNDTLWLCCKDDVGAAKWRNITTPRFRQSAPSEPGVNDDYASRYIGSSMWHMPTQGRSFVCTDPTTGAAVWSEFGGQYTRVKATRLTAYNLAASMTTIPWSGETDDDYAEFNTTTGTFTASADGQYVIEVRLASTDSGLGAAELWAGATPAKVRDIYLYSADEAHQTFILDLSANDQVQVRAQRVSGGANSLDIANSYFHIRRMR